MSGTESITDLRRVLTYENQRVINKFRTIFPVSMEEARDLFSELKKWLWLCARHKREQMEATIQDSRPLVIHVGMVIIDELWHTFILHTQEYADFCERYLGFFIHHSPGSPDFQPMSETETRNQLSYIWDSLGEESVMKWYEEFPARYSPENLQKLMRPPVFGRPCEAS